MTARNWNRLQAAKRLVRAGAHRSYGAMLEYIYNEQSVYLAVIGLDVARHELWLRGALLNEGEM